MASTTCPRCQFINVPGQSYCRGCGAALFEAAVQPQGYVLQDGYVLPPPPSVGMHQAGLWRTANTLVMTKDVELPDRCLKCNAPANGYRLKRTLSWHHPALYLLLLVAVLVYFIVAMVMRKTAIVFVGLCESHRQRRKIFLGLFWSLGGLGLLAIIAAIVFDEASIAGFGALAFVAAVVFGVLAARVVLPRRIDDHYVWLNGVSRDFLDSLPLWPGN